MMRNNYHNSQQQQSQDSITKISRSKSRNQMNIVTKLKQKESGWNDRFHLNQIPQYNYQNQPHSQYLKNKFRIPRKNDHSKAKRVHQPSLDKNKVSNKPNPRRNQERLKQAINKAFSDLKTLWFQKGVPQCHVEVMTKIFNRQNNPMKILQDIKQQFSQVSKGVSLVQKINSSIETRQNCLKSIKQLIEQFQEDRNITKYSKLFQEKISHLRILTIHCIQCIYQWKQSIEPLVSKLFKVVFKFNNEVYTKKIKQDYMQIKNGLFKQIYKFDEKKMDAFFLNYTLDGKRISNVSKNLVKRIRLCQIMLGQEEQMDEKPQEESQSIRTPMIEKMRSPPYDRKDKSMPSRGKTPITNPWKKLSLEYGQFHDYFVNLLKKSAFQKSYIPAVDFQKYQEITVFQFIQTSQQIVLGVDKFASQRKITILGIKSNLDTIQPFLKNCLQYLWEYDLCNQLRMSLVHHKINENLSVDVDLQKKIKSIGFRWVSVSNNNDQRMTIYSIKRPLNTAAHKSSKRTQAYPVVVEHLTILNLQQNNQKKFINNCQIGVLSLLKHLQELKKEQHQQICKRDEFSYHLDCIKKIEDFLKKEAMRQNILQGYDTMFTYSGLRPFQIQNDENLDKIFRNVEISSKQIDQFPAYITLLNTSFKYKNTSLNDGKYTKFFPSKDNQILICQSNYPIYLLNTDEQNISFFIIEVQENFSMESIDNIFHAMGEQSSFIDQFWLPTFKKSGVYSDEAGLYNRQLISTDYKNNLGSLTRKSKVRTKIIKAPFVFGMIHKKLLQMLQIPFYCTLVRKSDLL